MSYMKLIVFRNNQAECDEEYRNSWGGAAMVWSALVRKYRSVIYPDNQPFRNPFFEWEDLFKAVKEERVKLRPWEHWVLEWAFDFALVKRESFATLADSLERFEDAHALPNQVCHLAAIAKRLRELVTDETVQAMGLYATSVGENVWFEHVADEDETVAYNLATGSKHWFVEAPAAT